MSNQLQITGGAKVRSLEGVITGTTGVLGSLPINASNGIPQLDVNGKILVSQLPNSVMEYLGTWNAATNTPTLANGTGNAGDVYLCNVAGTANFGAGPITFFVGDQVIYSGSIWQRASGATGTVTSVAVTESGDALSITGSPITTSGTINIGFAGTSAQYVAGNGALVTFPTLTGYVPYKGATADLNLGLFDLKTAKVWLYDVPNDGYGSMELTDGVLHFEDVDGHSMVTMEDGYLTIANASTIRALLNVSGLSANRDYAFPNASGTLALTTDIANFTANSPLSYSGGVLSISQATTSTNGYLSSTDWNTFNNKQNALGFVPIGGSGSINYISKFTGSTTISQSGIYEGVTNYVSIGNTNTTYNLDVTGTARVTGDVIFGNAFTLTGSSFMDSMTHIKQVSVMYPSAGYTTIAGSSTGLTLNLGGAYNLGLIFPTAASYNYTYPAASGTVALTSDLSSYVPTSRTISTTAPLQGGGDLSANKTLSITQATTSTNGYLSSTDWNTFNGKQNALTNPVTGTGTSGYVTYFNGTSSVAGSSSLFWDATNNRLGIGTSSPSFGRLWVEQDSSWGAIINTSTAQAPTIYLRNVGSADNGYINSNTALGFRTGDTERMRITSGGNIRTYVTPAVDTNIEWYNTSSGTIAGRVWADGNPRMNVQCNSAGGVYLASAGVAWIALSDERLKTDLVPIDDALNKVTSLRSVIGRYKTDEVGTKRPFLIAQDVLKVFPEIVDIDEKSGDLGLSYTEIIPLLVGAIKELKAEIDELKNK